MSVRTVAAVLAVVVMGSLTPLGRADAADFLLTGKWENGKATTTVGSSYVTTTADTFSGFQGNAICEEIVDGGLPTNNCSANLSVTT